MDSAWPERHRFFFVNAFFQSHGNPLTPMNRPILEPTQIHPAIQEKIATAHHDIVWEVQQAIAQNELVVVGMAYNPEVSAVRRALNQAGLTHTYLAYGSYVSQWRRRNALKMWTGWPTFPMVFHKGILLGGKTDTLALLASGQLA